MSKVVVFDIRDGNFEQGFSVTVRIRKEDGNDYRVEEGSFPAAPNIPHLYKNFQEIYKSLGERGIECEANQITNVSTIREFHEAADALKVSLSNWFEHHNIRELRLYVEEEVTKEESARIIFLTNNQILKKLPWHLWQLFQKREKAWFSLGAKYNDVCQPLKCPVSILVILGSDKDINLTPDEKILINIPGARVKALKQPTREELCSQLYNNSWDVLCFAGHSITSSDGNDGVIQINDMDSPSLQNLRSAFKKAIKKGLKLAIFNSCDGLGLASKLTELGIPQVIVMREPVPDKVAQKFLKEFLSLFSQGEKFHLAMRQAQERLEEIEHLYPYASWLPVICQNPSEKSLTWRQPITVRIERTIRKLWRRNKDVVVASCVVAGLIIGLTLHYVYSPPLINEVFSQGERLLLNQSQWNIANKQKGVDAFSQGLWDDAINYFSQYRLIAKENQNDPEALVYLNNAIAMKKGNPAKIAVAVSVLGTPGYDAEILRGVAHAQSEFNCGSVDNIINVIQTKNIQNCTNIKAQPLLVEIANDSGQNDIAIKVAHHIVYDSSQNKILAVIGHNTSRLTIKTVENEYKENILVITPTGNSTNFDNNFGYKVLRTVVNNTYEVNDFYDYLKKKFNGKNINVIFAYQQGEEFSESLKQEFIKNRNSISNLMDINPVNLEDYNAENKILDLAKDQKANVIVLAPSADEKSLRTALEVIKQVSNSKAYENVIILGASTLYKPETRSTEFGKASEKSKLTVSTPWHRSNSPFETQANKIWGTSQINWTTAMSYDATKVIIQGLKNIQGKPNREILKNTLLNNKTFSTSGATTNVQFELGGGRKRSSGLGVLVKVKCKGEECNFQDLDS